MEIKIDGEAAREIVHKAIFDSITQDNRDALVKQAISALTQAPPRAGYGAPDPQTPLQEAFNMAVRQVATSVVREYLDDEKVKQSIHDQIFAVLQKTVEDNGGGWLYDQIGLAVGESIMNTLKEKKW